MAVKQKILVHRSHLSLNLKKFTTGKVDDAPECDKFSKYYCDFSPENGNGGFCKHFIFFN
ncbi:hypothetical protein C5167_001470 [Papaver somniferum]|uniref:Uncharacterized protein n=1 Tax=Papaver somniferum TaxID=3469 RepID=A0A4Y7KYU6_PAPSO|nr:hypothetical protein C5167_001470 [Papaver somniferum]